MNWISIAMSGTAVMIFLTAVLFLFEIRKRMEDGLKRTYTFGIIALFLAASVRTINQMNFFADSIRTYVTGALIIALSSLILIGVVNYYMIIKNITDREIHFVSRADYKGRIRDKLQKIKRPKKEKEIKHLIRYVKKHK